MKKIKILISGAGPAGLATAIGLDNDRYDVTVVDKNENFSSMGYSIILWTTGYEILKNLVGSKEVESVFPINAFNIYGGEKCEKLQSTDTTNIGFSIKREDLIRQLSEKFIEIRGLNSVIFNTEISDLKYTSSGKVIATFNNNKSEEYDLVILADGIRSTLRNKYFQVSDKKTPYKITYAWLERGIAPHDEAILGFMKDYVYLIQSVGADTLIAYYNYGDVEKNTDFLQKISRNFEKQRGEKITINQSTIRDFISEKISVKKMFNDRIVLMGDSAHGHPPTGALGTSLALEDAEEFYSAMNSINIDNFEEQYLNKLKEYSKNRHYRVSRAFRVQDFAENQLITRSRIRAGLDWLIIKYGPWSFIEKPVLTTISGGKDRQH